MKKPFNKRKFARRTSGGDSRPRREEDAKRPHGDDRERRAGNQRRDDKRGGGHGERKEYGEKRETREGSQRRDDRRGGHGGKKEYGDKRETREGSQRRDDRRGGHGGKKEYGDKRETRGGSQRRDGGGGRYNERRSDDRVKKEYGDKRERREGPPQRDNREQRSGNRYGERKNFGERREGNQYRGSGERRGGGYDRRKEYDKKREDNLKKAFTRSKDNFSRTSAAQSPASEGLIRLNRYLANAGICSRREADTFIAAGTVTVNGKIITQLGYKVTPGDKVQFGGSPVRREKSVYILLNKPKGYITTTDDEHDRETVLDLVQGVEERIYPVGRLDRNTSGLLLLTNDGELAKILMHPKYQVPKVYHVILDSALKPDDLEKIRNGLELEDGFIKPDDVAYVEGAETKKEVGIEIHSGKNRIVRRIFEHLGYVILKLDRVLYAGLTKKNLSRGKWRFLAENEVRMLKRTK